MLLDFIWTHNCFCNNASLALSDFKIIIRAFDVKRMAGFERETPESTLLGRMTQNGVRTRREINFMLW
jgi:hypothetical protein